MVAFVISLPVEEQSGDISDSTAPDLKTDEQFLSPYYPLYPYPYGLSPYSLYGYPYWGYGYGYPYWGYLG